jgi:cell division protein FtsL
MKKHHISLIGLAVSTSNLLFQIVYSYPSQLQTQKEIQDIRDYVYNVKMKNEQN